MGSSPWRTWKRLTAASTKESNTGPMPASWSRSPEATRRWRKACTALDFEPIFSSTGGNRVPAAARNDALIELDRLFGGLDRRRRQRRRALAADRDAIRGLVALAPLGLVVAGLLRAGRQGGQGRAGEGADRDAGKKSASIDARKPSSRHEQAKPLDDPRQTPFPAVAPHAAFAIGAGSRFDCDDPALPVTRRPFGRIYGRAQLIRKRERAQQKRAPAEGALADLFS